MFNSAEYYRTETDYRREQMRRAYRPLVTLRAAQALTRNRTRRTDGGERV